MKWTKIGVYLVMAVVLGGVLLAACARAGTPPVGPAEEAGAERGKVLYAQYCAACHGQNAEGSASYPALPGHSEQVVTRQVRSPLGNMPAFSESQISDADLELLAHFIASLPAVEKHIEPAEMEDALVMHHWMSILSLKAGDAKEALHHIDHILAMELEHEHEEGMERARQLVVSGNHHGAEHEIEEMLAGKAEPELGLDTLHLQVTLASIGSRDLDDAQHHMEHYLDMATGTDRVKAQEVLALLANQESHDAEHEIEELLEMTPHGAHGE
jgi:mono/diheme cytochrome c family protein